MESIRRGLFPYGMERAENGNWFFFNRSYKAAGTVSKDWIEYDDPKHLFSVKGLGLATLRKLSVDGHGVGDRIYFYDDSCIPGMSKASTELYLEKLSILISLRSG